MILDVASWTWLKWLIFCHLFPRLEAVYCGCVPVAPNRLVYPEIYPKENLFNTPKQLLKMLANWCSKPALFRKHREKFFECFDFQPYSTKSLLPFYMEKVQNCTTKKWLEIWIKAKQHFPTEWSIERFCFINSVQFKVISFSSPTNDVSNAPNSNVKLEVFKPSKWAALISVFDFSLIPRKIGRRSRKDLILWTSAHRVIYKQRLTTPIFSKQVLWFILPFKCWKRVPLKWIRWIQQAEYRKNMQSF